MLKSLKGIAIMTVLATAVVSNADDKGRLYITGDATPGGWDLDKAQALQATEDNPSVYSGTIYLNNTGEFKFLADHEWGGQEYGLAPEAPEMPEPPDIHKYKAPLYWSVYEYCYIREQQGDSNIDITPGEWDKIIDWVARDLKPYGYDMICTDGFIPMLANDNTGYMTHYGSISLKDLIAKCKAKGLKVGIYDNPLWIHGPMDTRIEGTDYTFGDLCYNGSNPVCNNGATDKWFTWAVAENPGCKEFIDGFFKHYKELGVDYIRMDFLSWYEDGNDRGMGTVGRGYGRDSYAKALSYISEAAAKYDIFISLVMPHLYNDAELEAVHGNMVRIVADTATGGWRHCSGADRGQWFSTWPNCNNQFDGFTYWSKISGRGKVIPDGDFLRLNTFANDDEKMTEVSINLMAGGPVTVADQYHSIGDNLRFYTNEEMLALNADGFVGKPLSDALGDDKNCIWYGQMTDGDYVVALFNRDDFSRHVSVTLADLGIEGEWQQRDLWHHADEGSSTAVSADLPAHGCKVVRLSNAACGAEKSSQDSGSKPSYAAAKVSSDGTFALASGQLDNGYAKLSVDRPGNYFISIDTENLKGEIIRSPFQDAPVSYSSLHIVGGATAGGWSIPDATPLHQSPSQPNIYANDLQLKAGGESFKIIKSMRGARSWDSQYFYFRHPDDEAKISSDGTDDRQWSVGSDGKYTVKVDTGNGTITISPKGSESLVDIVAADASGIVEYYTLQGAKILTPSRGLYIRVTNGKAEKIIL